MHPSSLQQGNGVSQQHQNLHSFLVQTKTGSLKKKTNVIKNAFITPKFKTVEVLETQSLLKISAYKGTGLKDIKGILSTLDIVITGCQEAYSNSAPSFFITQ